jgi:uncharacterized protein YbgA (DUF1722 family)/uncharacterized protein YbbK (DUF523 family)
MQKILIGISSCLLGDKVRYDGGHKWDAYINGTLSRFFEFVSLCPEVGIGLGVPRATIRLVSCEAEIRVQGSNDPALDVTEKLQQYALDNLDQCRNLSGYILKSRSPSCGLERVPVWHGAGYHKTGQGAYAEALGKSFPLMPMEEEGRLGDSGLRENFIKRVFVYHRWQQLDQGLLSLEQLASFHARHKLIVMSHNQNVVRELGRLVANANRDKENLQAVAASYLELLMPALAEPATRANHVNVLQHVQGYLKRDLDKEDKAELVETIDAYRCGELPLIVPITLLRHHFRKAPDPYIEKSWYINPHPAELGLLNKL